MQISQPVKMFQGEKTCHLKNSHIPIGFYKHMNNIHLLLSTYMLCKVQSCESDSNHLPLLVVQTTCSFHRCKIMPEQGGNTPEVTHHTIRERYYISISVFWLQIYLYHKGLLPNKCAFFNEMSIPVLWI